MSSKLSVNNTGDCIERTIYCGELRNPVTFIDRGIYLCPFNGLAHYPGGTNDLEERKHDNCSYLLTIEPFLFANHESCIELVGLNIEKVS